MKTVWYLVTLALINVLYSSHVVADESPNGMKQIVAGLVVFPPLTVAGEVETECTGPAVDTLKSIFANSEYSLAVVCAPAARIYKMLKHGSLDITVNVKSTKALTGSVTFVEPKFVDLRLVFVHNGENTNRVAAIRGFDYHGLRTQLVQDGYVFVDMPSAVDAIAMYMHKRTGYLLTYLGPYESYINSLGMNVEELGEVSFLLDIPSHIGISLHSPHYQSLIEYLLLQQESNEFEEYLQYFSVDSSK